ncbi:hypothetical protein ACODT5_01365 [Streptomyces sp. 5.8]|uniref:hypothetical protein n=1 Tax=Streptomyces sp. 5.8 TaxID=3406571 RepID=UPI003BB4AA69
MTVRSLTELTAEELSAWEQPEWRDINLQYWAEIKYVGSRLPFDLDLPTGSVTAPGVLPKRPITVYVDNVEGWLWVAVERAAPYWHPGDHRRDWVRQEDIVPPWVLGKYAKYPLTDHPNKQMPFLVRRPLAAGEAAVYLDEIMPPASAYPVAEELATLLRAGGWRPKDLDRLWWTLDTPEDAAALAARPPRWWRVNRWPMLLSKAPIIQVMARPATRDLAVLLDHDVRGDVVSAYRDRGRYDVAQLLALRPPAIPDDAARIEFTNHNHHSWFAYTAEAARTHAAKHPSAWLDPVVIETGDITPVHVDGSSPLVVWSDGRLDKGELLNLDARLFGHKRPPALNRLEAVKHLLPEILLATNRAALDATVLLAWLDADHSESDRVEEHSSQYPIARGSTAFRRVVLTRHAVHHAERQVPSLWQIDQTILLQYPHQKAPEEHEFVSHHAFYTDEAEARVALEAANDGLPPVMTTTDMAQLFETTEAALGQALRRHRAQFDSREDFPPDLDPGFVATTGRTRWYEPRAVRAWWDARPGHGPGRGHTRRTP